MNAHPYSAHPRDLDHEIEDSFARLAELLNAEEPTSTRHVRHLVCFIRDRVADHHGISLGWLLGRNRESRPTWARQVGMFFCRELTHASYHQIATAFRRNHGTAITNVKAVQNAASVYPSIKAELGALRAKLLRPPTPLTSISIHSP